MAHLNQDVLLFIIKRTKEEEEEKKRPRILAKWALSVWVQYATGNLFLYFHVEWEIKGHVDRRGGLEDGLKQQICSKEEEEKKKKREDLQLESFRSNPSKSIKKISTFEIPAKSAEPHRRDPGER